MKKALLFRFTAILLGLSPFLLLELGLYLGSWGEKRPRSDPFAGFHPSTPLFERDASGETFSISEKHTQFFIPDTFKAEKSPGSYRVFCLGGSTVQGRPFSIETSFSTWLQLSLQAAQPDREMEVINCGGISYASYRLVFILKEALNYSPDLIILYTGHNEFLEDRSYNHLKEIPPWAQRPLKAAYNLRSIRWIQSLFRAGDGESGNSEKPIFDAKVQARLDSPGGLELYRRDPKWQRDVIAHYLSALKTMAHLCREANVPLILMNPVSNLRDCPPFKSENDDRLNSEQITSFNAKVKKAKTLFSSSKLQALAQLEEAVQIDPLHAGVQFQLAKSYDSLGMNAKARRAYEEALKNDICPLRMLPSMHLILKELQRELDLPFFDAQALFQKASGEKAVGSEGLVDHVHPSIEGHKKIAQGLFEVIQAEGWVKPAPNWVKRQSEAYLRHGQTLDDLYYTQGQKRLEGLRAWARGRVESWGEENP